MMYKISTITAIGSVGSGVDISELFARVPLEEGGEGGGDAADPPVVVFAQLSAGMRCRADGPPAPVPCRGAPPPHKATRGVGKAQRRVHARLPQPPVLPHVLEERDLPASKASKASKMSKVSKADAAASDTALQPPRRLFDNQVTLLLRLPPPAATAAAVYANVKVFRSGSVQITGLKRPEQGEQVVDHIVRVLREMPGAALAPDGLRRARYKVCMMNSDLRLGFEVRRDRLFQLIRAHYRTRCVYEPCIYPGVKIYVHCNATVMCGPDGECRCTMPCDGRGDGNGNGDCRQVLLAVFQSGHVIATGAHEVAQLETAYAFVACLVRRHRAAFELVPDVATKAAADGV